jgi:hypothetical protein
MAKEICKHCGEIMTEQRGAYETANLAGVPSHSTRFYEQWFICRNGHQKGYISGPGWLVADTRVLSETSSVIVRT